MDIMDMAGHVSLSELHNDVVVEGPYYRNPNDKKFHQNAVIWLKNGYGVSIVKGDNPLQSYKNPADGDTAELKVVRSTREGRVDDYQNPVTDDVLSSVTVSEIVAALIMLKDLVNDPDDVNSREPLS